ncbi:TlpA disulfide reductase family protein [uncultured Thiodictyon sp.]|uniref:TlpA disulfide reductase family protein n=1 Tax=uncultured Thiodictyon sp. TaxID=1846217 RepID=UPI0025D475A8|nr:TlpA disulfide reductase family protein [uncultured Thiodictyon sp.]
MAIGLPAPASAIEEGRPAPGFDAKRLDGASFDAMRLRGKVVVLHFWATWCSSCRQEMPVLDAYYRAHHDQGLEMLAISLDEPEDIAKVRSVMADYRFPAAMMGEAHVQDYGRIWALPLTFVIDRDGVLRKDEWHGPPTIDRAALERVVTPLLTASPH